MDYIDRLIPVPKERIQYGESIICKEALRQAWHMNLLRRFNEALTLTYVKPLELIPRTNEGLCTARSVLECPYSHYCTTLWDLREDQKYLLHEQVESLDYTTNQFTETFIATCPITKWRGPWKVILRG